MKYIFSAGNNDRWLNFAGKIIITNKHVCLLIALFKIKFISFTSYGCFLAYL